MRIRFALAFLVLSATSVFAVAPQFWRTRNADEYLAGEIDGFAVTARGELRSGPSLEKIAAFTDPFVLSQAMAPNGDRFFGTGNDGKVYRLRGKEMKLLFSASEPEIYTLAFHDGVLYAGSSPNGKIYRVDPSDGKSSVLFDPKQAYIWAIDFLGNGDLAVATGVEGKLFRVTPKGEGKVWYDAPETHLRSLAARSDGSLLVGSAGKGRIYELRADGSAHALYDSTLNEISSIYVEPSTGIAWAAGVSNVLPSSAPQKAQPKQGQGGSSGDKKDASAEPTPTVDVSVSFEDASTAAAQAGSGEIYKINTDGFVEIARKFDREMVYSISGARNGGILLSTGPQGRIYEIKDGEAALIAAVPEKQVVSISTSNGETLITTTNSGAVYRMTGAPAAKAEYRSAAKDVERFSHFGHFRIEGTNVGDGHVAVAFRSGNTRTPDSSWSGWTNAIAAAEGTITAPPGRYIQYKLTMPKPGADVSIDNVTVAYINRNVAPAIDTVAVQDPAVVFISSSYPASPQVVEASNPDEYGIFTSLETPRDKSDQGKKVFRKGFRTITWRAHDDNGDQLRYSLAFRKKGSEKWLRLRDNLEETQMNFDTSQLPDGLYELRLIVSDANDNPDGPLSDTKDGVMFQIDNTPPSINVTTQGDETVIRITDKLSTIGKVEYSADATKWIRLTPADGIADSSDETYKLKRNAVEGKFVIIRATDSFYNVATTSVTLP